MRTDRIYIARDGKSGMHVLVRILAVGDIGADCLPIDPDGFNELMMARDARSLVLAAKGLGPMLAREGDLAGRIFVPSELQRSIAGEMDLVPSDLGGLLSECYFDPYAEPIGTGGMAIGKSAERERRPQETYRRVRLLQCRRPILPRFAVPRRRRAAARLGLCEEPALDSPAHRRALQAGATRRPSWKPHGFARSSHRARKTGSIWAQQHALRSQWHTTRTTAQIPWRFRRAPRYPRGVAPLRRPSRHRKTVDAARHRSSPERRGERVHQVSHLARDETARRYRPQRRPEEDRWCYLVVSSDIGGKHVKDQMRIANRLLQAFDGRLFQPRLAYSGVKMTEIAPERKPRNIMEAMWLLARDHPDRYLLTCRRCMRTVLSGTRVANAHFAATHAVRLGARSTRLKSDSGSIAAPEIGGAHNQIDPRKASGHRVPF